MPTGVTGTPWNVAIVAALVLVVAACSPEPDGFSDVVSLRVGPETETSLSLDDGASLVIPQGAFASSTELRFGLISGSEVDDGSVENFDFEANGLPPPPEGFERVSAVYDFDADD